MCLEDVYKLGYGFKKYDIFNLLYKKWMFNVLIFEIIKKKKEIKKCKCILLWFYNLEIV